MASTELILAFIVATTVFAYVPGPAMLYVAAQTIARGRSAGLMASLGIHIGGYVHVLAAAAGLSVLFHAVPALYVAVKLAGAIYLVWLGVSLMPGSKRTVNDVPEFESKSTRLAFIESIAVEVLNPKTALFFLAFLPQFVDAGAALPVWIQFLIMGTIVNVMFSSADLLCVLFAGAVIDRLQTSERSQRVMQRLGGSLLIGLGIHLGLQRS